jgi:hypothetical protein
VDFDTENFLCEEITVDSIRYTYCQGNGGINNIIWTNNDYVYQLEAPFEKEEMLRISKTIE